MVVKKRGSTNNYYGRRCTPVSMDAYSMDSVSVYHSFRRKSKRRASGRSMKSYLNQAFDDPVRLKLGGEKRVRLWSTVAKWHNKNGVLTEALKRIHSSEQCYLWRLRRLEAPVLELDKTTCFHCIRDFDVFDVTIHIQ